MDPAPGPISLLLRPAMPHKDPAAVIGNTVLACLLFWVDDEMCAPEPPLDALREHWERHQADTSPELRANVEKWRPVVERDLNLAESLFADRKRFCFLFGMRKRLILTYVLMELETILVALNPPILHEDSPPPLIDSRSNRDIKTS